MRGSQSVNKLGGNQRGTHPKITNTTTTGIKRRVRIAKKRLNEGGALGSRVVTRGVKHSVNLIEGDAGEASLGEKLGESAVGVSGGVKRLRNADDPRGGLLELGEVLRRRELQPSHGDEAYRTGGRH